MKTCVKCKKEYKPRQKGQKRCDKCSKEYRLYLQTLREGDFTADGLDMNPVWEG